MFTRKRCPRCGGNIMIDRDFNGWYQQCLQCGYESNMANTAGVHLYDEEKRSDEVVAVE